MWFAINRGCSWKPFTAVHWPNVEMFWRRERQNVWTKHSLSSSTSPSRASEWLSVWIWRGRESCCNQKVKESFCKSCQWRFEALAPLLALDKVKPLQIPRERERPLCTDTKQPSETTLSPCLKLNKLERHASLTLKVSGGWNKCRCQ